MQRIFKRSHVQHTSLTPDKKLNSLIHGTLLYVNIYGSYKLWKTVWFFGPPRKSGFLAHPVYICKQQIYLHLWLHQLAHQVTKQNHRLALSCNRLSSGVDSLGYVGDEALSSVATRRYTPSSRGNRTRCTAGPTLCRPSCTKSHCDNVTKNQLIQWKLGNSDLV